LLSLQRRNPNGTDDTTGSITSQTTCGLTGEEQLSAAGLVHLNGRIYDPLLARFTSADPTVTEPMNLQGWNRYSYVGNDPLAFTDPNRFSFFSNFFKSIGNFFSGIVKSVANFLKNNFMSIVQIAINVAVTFATGNPLIGAAVAAAVVTGLSGDNLGQILKAAAITAVTTFAFQSIGPMPSLASIGGNPGYYVGYVAASAAVGCGSSVVSGGSCASGVLSAGVGAALAPVTKSVFQNRLHDVGDLVGGTIVGPSTPPARSKPPIVRLRGRWWLTRHGSNV
jgi:RHS repeat-associated protein